MELNSHIKSEVNDINLEDHQPSTVKSASKALSDGSRDDSPSPAYKHSWSVQQRLTLKILAESFCNHWRDLTAVFNHVHKSDLRRCGGLRRAVVNTQYNDMRRKFDATAATLQATVSPYEGSNLVSRAWLEKKADEIGIQLHATDGSNRSRIPDKHDARRRKRKRADAMDDSRTDYLPDRSAVKTHAISYSQTVNGLPFLPRTPTKHSVKQPNNGLLTPPDSRKRKLQCLTADKRLARIGFRAFTAQSQGTYDSSLGIRAGAFVHGYPTIPLARNLEDTRHREEALHHIAKHDHSRPSMFVSATKNPMRALHMLLHATQGEKTLAVIDLNVADESGNVQKAHHLKLKTEFNYTAAGEYLIFGGVKPEAVISYVPLSRLISNMPMTPESDDPFCFKLLQAHDRLSYARAALKKEILPMTYCLGRAVGELVGILCIPPKHFESGVWSLVQDYKFYNAEGGRKRGRWSDNLAFKNGAVQGYEAVQPHTLTSLEVERNFSLAREVIEIEDDSEPDLAEHSDSSSSNEDDAMPVAVEEWVQNTQASQSSLQYFDLETSKWKTQEDDLSDDFFGELRDIAGNVDTNKSEIDGDTLVENAMDLSQSVLQERQLGGDPGCGGFEMEIDPVIEDSVAVSMRSQPEEFEDVDALCADVMLMHGDGAVSSKKAEHDMDGDYEFSWTGM